MEFAPNVQDFPVDGINPKIETQVTKFLQKQPKCDGRGIVVAILDTGADPKAEGLHVTTEGKPKFIDVIDATGSGDIDTSKVVKLDKDSSTIITGASGRKLKIPESWECPSGEFHVGICYSWSLFPGGLKNRVKGELEEKHQEAHLQHKADLAKEILAAEKAADAAKKACADKDADATKVEAKIKASAVLEDLKKREAQLDKLGGEKDVGPMLDAVVFNDGKQWLACLSDEDGKLNNTPITNYKVRQEMALFDKVSMNYYALNIYDDGNVLSCVHCAGSHGTHVSGIVGANFPDKPEQNGMAPGCQLISIKIGDTRIGSMESMQGLNRAARSMLEAKCDIMNMSYGEATRDIRYGSFQKYCTELAREHGIILMTSAGNNGPCLSTLGAPACQSTAFISIGAMFTPRMINAMYGKTTMLSKPTAYTWSSRGPTGFGGHGISICAPGGAITAIPTFRLSGKQLMNGTSMASPNAAGTLAVLCSGLKAAGIEYHPYSIMRALANSSRQLESIEPWARGQGLIQCCDTFNWAVKNKEWMANNFEMQINVPDGRGGLRNCIYARDFEPTRNLRYTVFAQAKFPKKYPNEKKIGMEFQLSLVATKPWIKTAGFVMISGTIQRGFQVDIDPNHFSVEDGANYGEIHAILKDSPDLGPLFKVPVTLIKPMTPAAKDTMKFEHEMEAGLIKRHFVKVPAGATFMKVKYTPLSPETNKSLKYPVYWLQAVQLINGRATHWDAVVGRQQVEKNFTLPVRAGKVIELTMAQYSIMPGRTKAGLDISFSSLDFSEKEVHLKSTLASLHLCSEEQINCNPSCELNNHQLMLRPKSRKTAPSDSRDLTVFGDQLYTLTLTYSWEQALKGKVYPHFGKVEYILYSYPLDHKYWTVFDSNNCLIGNGQCYVPKSVDLVEGGKYTLKLILQSAKKETLKKFENLLLTLNTSLDKALSIPLYGSQVALLSEGSKLGKKAVKNRASIFMGAPKEPPKGVKPGSVLTGMLKSHKDAKTTLLSEDILRRSDGATGLLGREVAAGCRVSYTVPPAETKEKPTPPKKEEDQIQNDFIDAVAKALKDASDDYIETAWKTIGQGMLAGHKDSLKVMKIQLDVQSRLNKQAEKKDKDMTKETKIQNLQDIIAGAQTMIDKIDEATLSSFFGKNQASKDDVAGTEPTKEELKLKREMDFQKSLLLELLKKKLNLMQEKDKLENKDRAKDEGDEKEAALDPDVTETWKKLLEWVNKKEKDSDKEFMNIALWLAEKNQKFGRCLEILAAQALKPKTCSKSVFEKRISLLEKLGWNAHLSRQRRIMNFKYPKVARAL